ncbi:hypothetical protein [Rhodobacter ferrooxidans]|uniref:Transmembrane anchor protein n=1 Tax=Rhodobacter ferrooxidans TaxID=371731 RepID=C8S1U6_9RHOB|nr:hypothetical protein [Rhodobacter sp. SW2]EEW25044.1 hypothetical protein Rsw2DRAFT_2024 [Rhodobacter sp. SW2]
MNNKFDITRAPQVPPRAGAKIRSVETTSGGLIRSTMLSGVAALAVLTIVYLPSEYGIDPTGFGAVLGLTEMGQIKQQLYAEAEADAAATPVVLDPAVMARLDRMEAQLLAIGAIIGAPVTEAPAPTVETAPREEVVVVEPEPQAAPEAVSPEATPVVEDTATNSEPAAEAAAIEPAVEAAVAEAITSEWRDEVSYTLAPGEGIEVKLVMEEGQTARFEWTANGAVVNYDTHGDGSGQKISYETGRGVPEQAGELTAAFTGNHGWFWRNRTDAPVTMTLRTAGDYAELKAP